MRNATSTHRRPGWLEPLICFVIALVIGAVGASPATAIGPKNCPAKCGVTTVDCPAAGMQCGAGSNQFCKCEGAAGLCSCFAVFCPSGGGSGGGEDDLPIVPGDPV